MSSDFWGKIRRKWSLRQSSVGGVAYKARLFVIIHRRGGWVERWLEDAIFKARCCHLRATFLQITSFFSIHFSKVNFANGSFQWRIVTYWWHIGFPYFHNPTSERSFSLPDAPLAFHVFFCNPWPFVDFQGYVYSFFLFFFYSQLLGVFGLLTHTSTNLLPNPIIN